MGFKTELGLIISFGVSVILAIVSLGLTVAAKKSDLLNGPLVITLMFLLCTFIVLSPISFFYTRQSLKLPINIFMVLLVSCIIVIGGFLISESLDSWTRAENLHRRTRNRMVNASDVFHVETNEYKITVCAGAIALAGAALHGIAKIVEATRSGQK